MAARLALARVAIDPFCQLDYHAPPLKSDRGLWRPAPKTFCFD
jgi:hypothetical protein